MILFLYGTEEILLEERLQEELEKFARKHPGVAKEMYDVIDEEQWAGCQQSLKTAGLFSAMQCIVVRHPSERTEELARIFEEFSVADDTERTVILLGEKLEKKLASAKGGSASGGKDPTVIEVASLTGTALEKWVQKRAERIGGRIDMPAIRTLILYTNIPPDQYKKIEKPNLWRLSSEIDKLTAYATSNGQPITEATVKLLVTPPALLNIFTITDALAAKDRSGAVVGLARHLEEGSDPFHLFSMFVFQFRNLLRVKSLSGPKATPATIAAKTKMPPFVARKTFDAARGFEFEELKRLFLNLIRLERNAKSGRADMIDGLYSFVFSLKS
ncbi:MAG: DNA polymerase III subunit delta [Candidatus Yanofskybacteria bacterium RIFCSPLOWO2_01_FULL_49_25]|uniref:DNA-directed DNA polymerase n=1 Tax=Candidatus Yanofskybacteria bacterium RIFCSPLOWO2_01_FULL_49_25 TaxID=1802701 RepID=A0A1F8GVM3_9BACT|nr:MAG: DNA polymerase III subunit delta [Candidatus Yanofskybacteria bacterium RIFCSPLOWO2_01_FULL_49_25]